MYTTARIVGHRYLWIDGKVQEEQDIEAMYRRLRNRALGWQVWAALTGRSQRLVPLAAVETTCTVVACRDAGMQMVPIDRIRGSSNRCSDFDAAFRPLHSHDQARWSSVAAARLHGAKLPPVELIEVAGTYFVVDGHHRISVAQALGDGQIRAKVTSWQVSGSLPWEKTKN